MPIDNAAFQVLRGLDYAKKNSYNEPGTELIDIAESQVETNKSATTILLEDFSERLNIKDSHNGSLTETETKKSFFEKKNSDNIFRSEEVKNYLNENSVISQSDIFNQANKKDGGIKYANQNDDIYESALNFAKADINLIETTYEKENVDWTLGTDAKIDGELNLQEAKKYLTDLSASEILNYFEKIDLDGNLETLSFEEYASYLIAADGTIEFGLSNSGFCENAPDGLVSEQEATIASQYSNSQFKEYAQKIYNEHYAN